MSQVQTTNTTTLTQEQSAAQRHALARWEAYTTGNTYLLTVKSRTMDHTFQREAHGKNVWQAVLRYYRGLDNADNWTWQCTRVTRAQLVQEDSGESPESFLMGSTGW